MRIVDLQEGTFYADLVFDRNITVSARPSDSVAIALRVGVPIYVEEAVLAQAGLLIPDETDEEGAPPSARTRWRSSRNFSTACLPTISRPPSRFCGRLRARRAASYWLRGAPGTRTNLGVDITDPSQLAVGCRHAWRIARPVSPAAAIL